MIHGLNIRKDAELDFLSLGALVHRLDPGIIPFRKATECKIHVSGGEFNVAANLADCFGLKTAIVSAMADYPIGALIAERVRATVERPMAASRTDERVAADRDVAAAAAKPLHEVRVIAVAYA